jgi:hypothetical protein
MSRFALILLPAPNPMTLCIAASAAGAVPVTKLDSDLGALRTTVHELVPDE